MIIAYGLNEQLVVCKSSIDGMSKSPDAFSQELCPEKSIKRTQKPARQIDAGSFSQLRSIYANWREKGGGRREEGRGKREEGGSRPGGRREDRDGYVKHEN